MTNEGLMTTAQVAQCLGISISTTGRLIRSGRLIAKVKVPGQTGAYLFTEAEVARAKQERESETSAA